MDTLSNVDLIDDIWQRIFESVDYKLRILLFQVCKRWKSIASSPLCWTSLNVKFADPISLREQTEGAKKAVNSFCLFVTKYCTLATKISIEKHDSSQFRQILLALLPLRHLRYLKISITTIPLGVESNSAWTSLPKPIWENLVHFHLKAPYLTVLTSEDWAQLFEGAPNLEELYFPMATLPAQSLLKSLPGLPKLQILGVPKILREQTSSIVKKAPQLRILIFNDAENAVGLFGAAPQNANPFGGGGFGENPNPFGGGFGAPNPAPFGGGGGGFGFGVPNPNPAPFGGGGGGFGLGVPNPEAPQVFMQIEGTTLVIDNNTLRSRDLTVIKSVGHILKKSNYGQYFVVRNNEGFMPPLTEPLMHYLFKELKLDINLSPNNQDPFSVELFPQTFPSFNDFPLACVLKDVEQTRLMLDFGADPNYPEKHVSPFTRFDISKQSAILLLERGADPLKKDHDGQAAMSHLFQKLGDDDLLEVITTILNKGVDPDQLMSGSTTMLDLAVEKGRILTATSLVKHGARWTPKAMDKLIHRDLQLWKQVISNGEFDTKQLLLITALVAIKNNCYDMLRDYLNNLPRDLDSAGLGLVHYLVLLSQNTPIIEKQQKAGGFDSFAGFGNTTAAKVRTTAPSTPESLDFLKQMIKDLSLDVNTKTSNGETALLLICQDKELTDEGVVQVLIEAGADVNEPDASGWTPLHAALYRNRNVAELLLSNGANINAQDSTGITPVMALFIADRPRGDFAWDAALKHGFDVAITEKYLGRSILHYMAALNRPEGVYQLIERNPGIDVNCRDVHGFTPLHYAALGGRTDIMELLTKHGADTNATTNTLKLTPFLTFTSARQSPYHHYLPSYTSDIAHTVSVFAGPASSALLCRIVKPSWSPVKGNRFAPGLLQKSSSLVLGGNLPWPTDLTITDRFGNNTLHGLVWGQFENLFLDDWTAPNGLVNLWSTPNKRGTTPFHELIRESLGRKLPYGPETLSNYFRKHKDHIVYSLNNRDEYGMTALEYLFQSTSNSDWVQDFLYTIPGVNITSQIVQVPSISLVHEAIKNNTYNKTLLTKVQQSDPNALNVQINGQTPLHVFVERLFGKDVYGEDVMLDIFLDLKVDLDAQDKYGNTVLHYACYFFSLAGWDEYNKMETLNNARFCTVLFKLIEAGARLDIKNDEGQAPIDIIPNLLELDRSLLHLIEARRKENNPLSRSKTM